jgi:spore germination protein YaaH
MSSKTRSNPLIQSFELILESRLGGVVINFVLIPVLVLSALLLPPVSLADRLLSIGYDSIGRDGGAIQDPDGTQITFLPEGVSRKFRIKLNAIPRSLFLEGAAGNSLLTAAESIPPNLIMKSPFYQVQRKGTSPEKVMLTIPIPNESEPYGTLDLYSWTGESWEWLPNRKVVTEDIIEAELDFLPESVVVMQTHAVHPAVSTNYAANTPLPDNVTDSLVEINPQGLYLDSEGRISGNSGQLPAEAQNAAFSILPTLRNWTDDGSIRSDLVDNLLIDSEARQRLVEAIADQVQRNAYQGIDIDFRGINPDLQPEFSSFLQQLRAAMPDNKLLSVRVELPVQVSADTWNTGAYNWRAIGRIVDVVKVPTAPDPKAYTAGGQMDAMLNWAVGQVNRYKIQLLLSTYSTEQVNGITRDISYQQALEPIGAVTVVGGENIVGPGQSVDFTLTGLQSSTGIQFDSASGTYWFAYLDDNNIQHTVYLENAASISRKLQFVAQYNLRGVAVQNLLSENNDAQVWSVIRKFLDLVIPPVESQYSVVWQVKNEDGGVIAEDVVDLSQPNYKWTAPDAGGSYEVAAAISSNRDSAAAVPRGSVALLVATPTPTPSPTPLPSPTPEATATPEPTATPKPQPQEEAPAQEAPASSAPPPVAAAAGNLPFDYGIQADPMNSQGNAGLVAGMGFRWVKLQMPWKDVEPSPGNYQWGGWDDRIRTYQANGVKVLLSIPKAPGWARPAGHDTGSEGPPADPATYANFVGQVAGRYKDGVQAIEVWNEQNIDYEWGREPFDPARYMEILKASYNAIKGAAPNMIVVSGAPTPTGAPPPAAMDDVEYLRQMYAHGLKDYSDAIGSHPSGFANPPDALFTGGDYDPARGYDDHRSFFFRNTMEAYRQVMIENGDSAKTIWPTEFGWPVLRHDDGRFPFAAENSPDRQAQWSVQAYQLMKSWGWVGTAFLWNLDYNITAGNTELANFGIVGTPAYDALATMPK